MYMAVRTLRQYRQQVHGTKQNYLLPWQGFIISFKIISHINLQQHFPQL